VIVPDRLNLDKYLGKGRQAGEEDLDLEAPPGEDALYLDGEKS
jgi:hypothetical protein